jgi:hypothetical protein
MEKEFTTETREIEEVAREENFFCYRKKENLSSLATSSISLVSVVNLSKWALIRSNMSMSKI